MAFGGLFGGGDKKAELEAEESLQPPFKVIGKTEGYEVRLYDTYLYVSTPYDRRDEGIGALSSYFDGQNSVEVKIPATQPVVMQYEPLEGGGFAKSMRLYTPRAGEGPPPMPTSPNLQMQVSGAELVAVLRFSGNITQETADMAIKQLTNALAQDGITPKDADSGVFRMAQYGPLYSLSPRKNELWLQLDAADAAKFMA